MKSETITLTTKQWKEVFPGICPIGIESRLPGVPNWAVVLGVNGDGTSWLVSRSTTQAMHSWLDGANAMEFPIPTLISHVLGELVKTTEFPKAVTEAWANDDDVFINTKHHQIQIRHCPGAADLMQNKTFTIDSKGGWQSE